jgi:hypothetical protein
VGVGVIVLVGVGVTVGGGKVGHGLGPTLHDPPPSHIAR